MAHNHAHAAPNHGRAFAVALVLNAAYVAAEAAFGFLSGSLALLADAGHNLSDVLGLLLAWGASYAAGFPSSERRTYGWRSSTILAAVANGLLLLVAVGGIVWEAIRRLEEPAAVAGTTIIVVAAVGVAINGATALLFLRGRKDDLNVRGAFLHMAADAAVSLGVVVAGVAIRATGWTWIDPAVSLLVALVIFAGTWGLLRESLDLALHAVPRDVDLAAVRRYLRSVPGVEDVHDLHVWAMSTTQTAITAHLVKPAVENEDALLADVAHELHDRFGIEHATLQVERGPSPGCRQCE